jgi:hypothetical protein
MRPTLGDDIVAVLGHPSGQTLAALLAFTVGGVTIALWYRRAASRSI